MTSSADQIIAEGNVAKVEAMQAEIARLRALIHELQDALIWMSGSADFGPGGEAYEGWIKVRHLALANEKGK